MVGRIGKIYKTASFLSLYWLLLSQIFYLGLSDHFYVKIAENHMNLILLDGLICAYTISWYGQIVISCIIPSGFSVSLTVVFLLRNFTALFSYVINRLIFFSE